MSLLVAGGLACPHTVDTHESSILCSTGEGLTEMEGGGSP